MCDNLSLLDCIESMNKESYDHSDPTDSFQSNFPYTNDASWNRQNYELLDLDGDFDEAEFEELLNNSLAQIDTNSTSRKRKHSSELLDSKRQRLDTSEKEFEKLLRDSLDQIDPVKLSGPPNSSLTNGKSVKKNQSHSSEMEKSGNLSSNSELSGDKSNSSSVGKGYGSLKIVGKPLREKPRDEKKSKKSSTSSESLPPPPPQEKEQQKIVQKPSKITLSWKVMGPKQELTNNSTNVRHNYSDAMAREYRPKPVQIKILPTETLRPKQPNQMIEPQKLLSLTTASHLQAQHFENPKPTQKFYQNLTTQNISESNKFLNCPRQPEEAKFKSLPFSLMEASKKKLRLVTKDNANVSKACGEKSQPVVQRKNAEFHFVTLKKRPGENMSSEPQKIFKLVPFRSVKANME